MFSLQKADLSLLLASILSLFSALSYTEQIYFSFHVMWFENNSQTPLLIFSLPGWIALVPSTLPGWTWFWTLSLSWSLSSGWALVCHLKIGTQNWSRKCSRYRLPAEPRAGLSKPQTPHTHAHILCGQDTVIIAPVWKSFLEFQNAQLM